MKYYIKGFQNYFNVSDRCSREEFWYFFLFQLLLSIIFFFLPNYPLRIAFFLVTIIPCLSIQFRRLNDINKNKLWAILPIVLIIMDIILYFSMLNYHSMLKNFLFIILALMKAIFIIQLFVWYLKDSKGLSSE